MATGEADRHQLYATPERNLGKREADTMMALLPPVGWADVATKSDLAHLETRMNERIMRTAPAVNVPSIVAAVGPAFAAGRLG